MNSKRFHYFSVFLLINLFGQSFVFGQADPLPPPLENPTSKNEKIKPVQISADDLVHFGDLIEVDVLGSFEYDWRGTLTPEGFLDKVEFGDKSFYGLCRDVDKIAEDIEKEYGKFLREPKVEVRILDRSKRPNAFIYGAVKTQQRFSIKRPVKLNELIILSGGITDRASGEIQIFRSPSASCSQFLNTVETVESPENQQKERFLNASQDNGAQFINIKISDLLKGKEEFNPQILSGDTITIQEAKPIYVIGGVNNPKTISSREEFTLSRAIASAGSLTKDAEEKNITIIRREGTQTKIINADLSKVKKGEEDDVLLKPYDIVDVPQKGRKNRVYSQIPGEFDPKQENNLKLPLVIID
jgi:protein involved in polysaccharide export with SLBB domain